MASEEVVWARAQEGHYRQDPVRACTRCGKDTRCKKWPGPGVLCGPCWVGKPVGWGSSPYPWERPPTPMRVILLYVVVVALMGWLLFQSLEAETEELGQRILDLHEEATR